MTLYEITKTLFYDAKLMFSYKMSFFKFKKKKHEPQCPYLKKKLNKSIKPLKFIYC